MIEPVSYDSIAFLAWKCLTSIVSGSRLCHVFKELWLPINLSKNTETTRTKTFQPFLKKLLKYMEVLWHNLAVMFMIKIAFLSNYMKEWSHGSPTAIQKHALIDIISPFVWIYIVYQRTICFPFIILLKFISSGIKTFWKYDLHLNTLTSNKHFLGQRIHSSVEILTKKYT